MKQVARRRASVLVLTLLATVLFGLSMTLPHALAADALVTGTTVDGRRLELLVDDRREDAFSPPGTVVVHVNGTEVETAVTAVADPTVARAARTAILLVDTSGSMKGAGIAGARAAAQGYLDVVPADVRVGLTTFSDQVRTVVPPTTDRGALGRAVAGLVADGPTALNDGVLEALRVLGEDGERRLLLLSDGADSASNNSLEEVLAATSASKVEVVAVAFGTDDSARGSLEQLAARGRGRVVTAGDAAALTKAFQGAAQEFSGTLKVVGTLPVEASGRVVEVLVEVRQGARLTSDRTEVEVPAFAADTVDPADAPAAVAPLEQAWFGSTESLPWAGGALFLGLVALLAVAIGTGDSRAEGSRRTRQLLDRYTLTPQTEQAPAQPGVLGEGAVARSALELAGRVAQRQGVHQGLVQRLDHANVPLKPEEWVLLRFVAACVAAALCFLFINPAWLGLAVGLLLGLLAPKVYLSVRTSGRRKAFLEALPDSLQLCSGALSSGYSLPQALDTIVRDGAEPISGEIGRALTEARLGVPLETALDAVADRMSCEDFRWVVMAIRVQREVGGNLAGVLTTVTNTLRDRSRLRRQVKSLSAEGRLSAWVLIGLPILLGAYMYFFRNDYFRPMYETGAGITMLVLTAISMTIGALWMNKLVKVEV